MQWLTDLIDAILAFFKPKPPVSPPVPPPPVPAPVPPPVPVPVPPPPPPPVARVPITAQTKWRDVGTVTAARAAEILHGYPLGDDVAGVYAGAKGRALPMAQSWMESNYGQAANALATHNPLGLMESDGKTLQRFLTWGGAFDEWSRRMDDPSYKGGVYPRDATLEQFIVTYVGGPLCWSSRGGSCANGETWISTHLYLSETVDRLNRYFGVVAPSPPPPPPGTGILLPGLSVPISASFPIHVALIPRSQTNQRPGMNLSPRNKYIQHETGNQQPGANALMHSRYLDNGAEGQQLSYHFTVDEREAYLKIPLDEVTWHGGDGAAGARCNYTAISCELCVQDGNSHKVQARHNAEELAGKIINAANLATLERHGWCCEQAHAGTGCHYTCPETITREGYWQQFVVNAMRWAAQ